MATPRQPNRSSSTRPIARLFIVACAFLMGVTIAPATAAADPEPLPDTASEAAQQVSELERNLEILSEQQNDAQVALDQYIADAAATTVELGQVNDGGRDVHAHVHGPQRMQKHVVTSPMTGATNRAASIRPEPLDA